MIARPRRPRHRALRARSKLYTAHRMNRRRFLLSSIAAGAVAAAAPDGRVTVLLVDTDRVSTPSMNGFMGSFSNTLITRSRTGCSRNKSAGWVSKGRISLRTGIRLRSAGWWKPRTWSSRMGRRAFDYGRTAAARGSGRGGSFSRAGRDMTGGSGYEGSRGRRS
jgi:hypothetical protein